MNNTTEQKLSPEQELELLKKEKEQKERISKEIDRLWEMFPDFTLEQAPDELWELVQGGESLLGAYCILLAKANLEEQKANEKNQENSQKTPPPVKNSGDANQYFSREQVEKMTRDQVKKNYKQIIDSMKHWK